jgi:putative selenium metabolism hydrolase
VQISHRAEVLGFCQELLRQPSPSGHEEGVAASVEREMTMLGYDAVQRDALGSVVGLIHGASPGRTVLVDAHMDTVPVITPGAWRYEPHSGAVSEGCIWGRGAVDAKGSLAAAVVAAGSLHRSRLAGALIVAATVGGEAIEGLALERVLRAHPADVVIVCAPTGLGLGLGHKGRASLVITAEGVAAHSSLPARGVNAVYRMIEAVGRIRALELPKDDLLGVGTMELVEMVSAPLPGAFMVPHLCTARYDCRTVRGETAAGVLGQVRLATVGLRGIAVEYHRPQLQCYTGYTVAVDDYHPAWAISPSGEIARLAQNGLRSVGQAASVIYAPYCTNGAATAVQLGLPTLLYGAGEVDGAHIVNEALPLEQLDAVLQGYRGLMLTLTRSEGALS